MRGTTCSIWLLLILAAAPAHAHAPVPGIKGFYVGLLHPLSTPSQALLMLGLGLLVGGFAIERARLLFGAFFAACILGLFVGSKSYELDAAMFACAAVACTLAALLPGKLTPLAVVAAVAGALLIGSVSIPDAGPLSDRMFTMTGSVVGATIALLFLWGGRVLVHERFTAVWINLGFRVAAAWIGAISLLMLSLLFATASPAV